MKPEIKLLLSKFQNRSSVLYEPCIDYIEKHGLPYALPPEPHSKSNKNSQRYYNPNGNTKDNSTSAYRRAREKDLVRIKKYNKRHAQLTGI